MRSFKIEEVFYRTLPILLDPYIQPVERHKGGEKKTLYFFKPMTRRQIVAAFLEDDKQQLYRNNTTRKI